MIHFCWLLGVTEFQILVRGEKMVFISRSPLDPGAPGKYFFSEPIYFTLELRLPLIQTINEKQFEISSVETFEKSYWFPPFGDIVNVFPVTYLKKKKKKSLFLLASPTSASFLGDFRGTSFLRQVISVSLA